MYERNAIVLERYFGKKLGYQNTNNLINNFNNYCELLEKIEQFQCVALEEEKSSAEFEDISTQLISIQQTQEKLYKKNAKLEYSRNLLFANIEENVENLEKCLTKIEEDISKIQTSTIELREKFINTISLYQEKSKLLEEIRKHKNDAEEELKKCLEITKTNFEEIDEQLINYIKGINTEEIRRIKRELIDIITKNGAKEKIPFDSDVVSKSAEFATEISKKEAESYVIIYEKTKKLIEEVESNSLKLERHRKWKRDNDAKLKFFNAEREYLVQFLDNERLSIMHGKKVHRKLMLEACKNLILDVAQMNNLYELMLREEAGRSAKKAYKELYNKEYLRKIEEKERQYEDEAAKLNLNAATVINSNYWRIEGIREVYTTFYQIITEIYNKELENFEIATEEIKEQETSIENIELELPQATTIEQITAEEINEEASENIEEIDEDLEEDNFAEIENEIEILEEPEEIEDNDIEDDEFEVDLEEDIPYEEENVIDEDDIEVEESLLESVMKAKETQQDLKAALEAVKEVQNKKKKSGILKNLIKINARNKKVEG